MLCDNCKKNEATVHIKEFHNGSCETHHLCAECAQKKEQQGELGALGFKLSELLFNTIAGADTPTKKSSPTPEDTICPVCQWSTSKIRESSGKVGCPECYKVFAPILSEAFSKIQRGSVHLGKHPSGADKENNSGQLKLELKRLQNELAEFIAKEEYENAAVCRDRILAIRNQLEKN